MKKGTLWVAAVLALCASAAIVQTWSTSGVIDERPAPATVRSRNFTDIELPAPPPPAVRTVRPRAFTDAAPEQNGGGLKTKAGWVGAGLLAGHFIGPVGSVGVGAAKYRQDLKAGGKKRFGAIGKIGVPVAISVLAGPIGTAGYAGFQHRGWLKKHVLRIGTDDDEKEQDSKAKSLVRGKKGGDGARKPKSAKTKEKAAAKGH